MIEWLQLGLLFLLVLSACLAVFQVIAGFRAQARAARLDVPGAVDRPSVLTQALATPMSEAKRTTIAQELRQAGYYGRTAIVEYAAVRTLLVIAPLAIAGMLALAVPRQQMLPYVIVGVVGAVICYAVPRLWIQYVALRRQAEIERGLPVAVDLIALSLTGGQDLNTSLARASQQLTDSYPVLSEELGIVQRQAELGGLEPAMRQFADRTGVADVRNLAVVLTQTERLGGDVATSLFELSNHARTTIKHRAESHANRASFWMLFPTVVCLWMPAALLLVAPVYLDFVKKRGDTRELTEPHRGALQKAMDTAPQNRKAFTSTAP